MKLIDRHKERILFIVLGAIGVFGAFGQLSFLHNRLVHSYPFKMMHMPPFDFYASIGTIGYYIAAVAVVLAVVVSVKLPRYLTSTLPVVVCPLIYWLVFEAAHLSQGFSEDQMMTEGNFGGYTGNMARYEFGFDILVLLVFGAIIGSLIGIAAVKLASVRISKIA